MFNTVPKPIPARMKGLNRAEICDTNFIDFVNGLGQGPDAGPQDGAPVLPGSALDAKGFREVFESVLFLSALHIEGGGKHTNAIALGVVLATAIVLTFAFFVIKYSAKLPIPKLFKISAILMGILAVILAGKGIHSLQEVGLVPVHGMPLFRLEQLGIYPTWETTIAQLVVLLIVVGIQNINLGAKPELQRAA